LRKLLAAAVLAAALAVPASNASARAQTPANVWVSRVCGTLVAWEKSIVTGGKQLEKTLKGATTGPQVKRRFVAFLDTTVKVSDNLLRRIDAAGTPDVENGAAIRNAFHAALLKVRAIFAKARAQAAALPGSNPAKLASGAETIAKQLDRAGTAIQRTFNVIDKQHPSAELDRAFKRAPACRTVR
jgi:hypothetical protein